jgi:hypothetical protein
MADRAITPLPAGAPRRWPFVAFLALTIVLAGGLIAIAMHTYGGSTTTAGEQLAVSGASDPAATDAGPPAALIAPVIRPAPTLPPVLGTAAPTTAAPPRTTTTPPTTATPGDDVLHVTVAATPAHATVGQVVTFTAVATDAAAPIDTAGCWTSHAFGDETMGSSCVDDCGPPIGHVPVPPSATTRKLVFTHAYSRPGHYSAVFRFHAGGCDGLADQVQAVVPITVSS